MTTLTERPPVPATATAVQCPLCEAPMLQADEAYAMADIFRWWERDGTQFSAQVRRAHREDGRVELWQCGGCGLGRFEPAISGSPAFYEELERSAQDWYYLNEKWEFQAALASLRRLGCRTLLEVGCGDGRFLSLAARRCRLARVVGVEPSPTAAAAARQRGFEVWPTLERLLEHEERFDAVCAFQVLEHVADPAGFLAALRRVTAPGGSIVLGVPDQDGPIRHVRPYLHDLPPHHVTRWRADTFRRGVPRLGLQVAEVHSEPLARYHFKWLLPVYAVRLGPAPLRPLLRLAGAVAARLCLWTRVPRLPLRGHTVLVRLTPHSDARKEDG